MKLRALIRANEKYLALAAKPKRKGRPFPAQLRSVEEEEVAVGIFETYWPHGLKDGELIGVGDERGVVYVISPTEFAAVLSRPLDPGPYSVFRVSPDFLSELQLRALERLREPRAEHQRRFADILSASYPTGEPEPAPFDPIDGRLNESQREAVAKAITAAAEESFYLIHGPPGTGKTTVIAELAAQLLTSDMRVLICSNTNVAVDNALERLVALVPDVEDWVVRVGEPVKVSRRFRRSARSRVKVGLVTGATLSRLSILAAGGKLDWDDPWFDVCILDESSMATLPLTLCGAFAARSFVLVGDHLQLPPVVAAGGLKPRERALVATSPFELLIKMYPQRCTLLDVQYRCNPAIMSFSSAYIYGGKVKDAPAVASKRLELRRPRRGLYLREFVDAEPLVWIDTAGHSYEWVGGGAPSAINVYEAGLCAALAHDYAECGVDLESQCVITPYRAQALLVRRVLGRCVAGSERVDVFGLVELASSTATVEAFQGRERDLVIFSATHTSSLAKALTDVKKLNVSVTRASKKLVVVASSTLAAYARSPFYLLYQHVKERGRVVRGPPSRRLGEVLRTAREEARALRL